MRSGEARPSRRCLGGTAAGLIAAAALLSGCSASAPRAWEKDLLARPAMAMEGDPLERRFMQHIYTSKENSSRGDGVGGGGCGCN